LTDSSAAGHYTTTQEEITTEGVGLLQRSIFSESSNNSKSINNNTAKRATNDPGFISEDERINLIKEEFRDSTTTHQTQSQMEESTSSGNDGESSAGKK
jgi:hypothetical protein